MNNRRRQRGGNHHHHQHQDVQGSRARHRKPPHGSNWQPTVPSWEKRFCYSVGSVPWQKLLETKKFMYLYENVVKWNDSAGEEAFHNAKDRFWAEINGLPCNISLPDPDIYIDEVDWNCDVDPELLLDLEREPKVPDKRDAGEQVVILGSSLLNPSFSCTGWGEAEQEPQMTVNLRLDHGHGDFGQNASNHENHWDSNLVQTNGVTESNGWGDSGYDSHGWEKNHTGRENNHNGWDDDCHGWNNVDNKTGGDWGTWEDNIHEKKEGPGYYRYETTGYHADDYQVDRGWWRNGRGRKRVNFVC